MTNGKPPFIRRYESRDGSVVRYTLVRGGHRVHKDGASWPRETTTAFDKDEWDVIERAVFAKYGLVRDHDVARRHAEVADPPPLLAHGEEWVSDDSPR